MLTSLPVEKCSNMGSRTLFRVVKSSRLPAKIAVYLVSIGWLLCLAFLYRWWFLNKISLDWPLTLTLQNFPAGQPCSILLHFVFLFLLIILEQFSYDLEKWFQQVFVICFISQWMKRSKQGLFLFPPKKTLIWRTHCSTGQSCCSMTSKRSNGWFLESSQAWGFSPERSINQSNCSISVCLLFLFGSRVFISRSYENRSIVSNIVINK